MFLLFLSARCSAADIGVLATPVVQSNTDIGRTTQELRGTKCCHLLMCGANKIATLKITTKFWPPNDTIFWRQAVAFANGQNVWVRRKIGAVFVVPTQCFVFRKWPIWDGTVRHSAYGICTWMDVSTGSVSYETNSLYGVCRPLCSALDMRTEWQGVKWLVYWMCLFGFVLICKL